MAEVETTPTRSSLSKDIKPKMLIVEDDVEGLAFLKRAFSRAYTVLPASSGEQALDIFQQESPEIVLADNRMPGLKGIHVLERIYQLAPYSVRILITGYSDLDDVIYAINCGRIHNYVKKPFDLQELAKVVEESYQAQSIVTEAWRLSKVLTEKNRELKENEEKLTATVQSNSLELQQTYETLRTSERKYRNLYENAPDIYLEVTPEGNIATCNLTLERLLGLDPLLFENKPISTLAQSNADTEQKLLQIWQSANSGTEVFGAELALKSSDNQLYLFSLSATPIHTANNLIIGTHWILRNITYQREIEKKLYQTQKMESIGLLAAGVAHEINNPIMSIMMSLEQSMRLATDLRSLIIQHLFSLKTIIGQHCGAKTRANYPAIQLEQPVQTKLNFRKMFKALEEMYQDAFDNGIRIKNIVKDLQTFSDYRPEESLVFSIGEPIENAIRMLDNQLKISGQLSRQFDPTLTTRGDRVLFSQVILNILQNAIEALGKSTTVDHEIRISTQADAETILIEIEDNGDGIEEQFLEKVFDPFFSTKQPGEGVGLGLTVAYNIIKRMQGSLRLRSLKGENTTVSIELPHVLDTGISETKPNSASQYDSLAQKTDPSQNQNQRVLQVLIIDDEVYLLTAMKRFFKGSGYRVTIATNGSEAIQSLKQNPDIDAVICDLMMPEESGALVYQRITEIFPHLADRFIFCTGGNFTDEIDTFLSTEHRTVLYKPLDMAQLESLLIQMTAYSTG